MTIVISQIGFRSLPNNLIIGGIEVWINEISKRIHSDHIKFHVYPRSKYTETEADRTYVKEFPVGGIWTKNLETISSSLIATLQSIKSTDIVHYHGNLAALWSFIPKAFGKKVVVTLHGRDWERAKWGRLMKVVHRLSLVIAMNFADRIISVSENTSNLLSVKSRRKVDFIPNAPTHFPRARYTKTIPQCGPLNVCFLGRFVPEKRIEDLIFACSDNQDFELVIVGSAPYMDTYFEMLETIGKASNVKFLPPVFGEDKRAILSSSDCLVIPSDVEGMSLILLEAANLGIPTIASDIPENRWIMEKLTDNPDLYLFEIGNIEDLRAKLYYLKKHSCCQSWNTEIEKLLNWDKVAAKYKHIYEGVCK
ncbi:MAG: glycosyltransferase family 4 protein [Candidatus Thiodiazotropha taylori]